VSKARGYDEPAEEDFLDRRPLARAIADVISNTPPEFGVRVGLFGEWGSGKSSVLNFIEQILSRRGHVIVRFSPWGLTGHDELFTKLGETLLARFEKLGEQRGPALTHLKLKHFSKIRKALEAGKKTGGAIGGVASLLDSVSGSLKPTKEHLASIANAGERIVVMVDDVDRADPQLVPPMLFALRELFDVPRFSWLLAIDPVVVRAALKDYHPGFGLGRDFLEKIVDFPFTITPPPPPHRLRLLEGELADSGALLEDAGLADLAVLLPDNPRELRSIVRHFRSIAGTLKRLGTNEFDQRLLVILVVIHAAAPELLTRLLESQRALRKLTGIKFLDGEAAKKAHATAKQEIDRLLSNSAVRLAERKRLRSLLFRLSEAGYWAAETVVETGRLLQTAPVVTLREAADGVATHGKDASTLAQWLEGFSKEAERPKEDVRRAFFDQLLRLHTESMSRASDAFSQDESAAAVRSALETIRVLGLLIFDLGAGPGATGLDEMRKRFSQWAHFQNSDDYVTARREERECLLRFAALPGLDPLETLDRVVPAWLHDGADVPGEQAAKRLHRELLATLEPRAVVAFIGFLDKENMSAYYRGWKRAGQYLLRSKGRLWTQEFRSQLRAAFEGKRSSARSDNAVDMLRVLLDLHGHGSKGGLSDGDLVRLLWAASTAIAPNIRRFKSFQDLKRALEAAAELTLDEPAWWQAKLAQQRAVEEESPASDESDAPTNSQETQQPAPSLGEESSGGSETEQR